MGNFELVSDFVINDTLKPHVNDNFRVVDSPGQALHCDPNTGEAVYPKILTTGAGNGVHRPFIFTKLIAMTGKERPNVVYIGTPFFDREDKYESGTESFRGIGCRIKRLMVAKEDTTPSPEEMRRIMVDWSDLIMISGGNSLFALLRWQSIGLDLLIKEAAVRGKVLCGGSAGCGCYFDSMQTDSLKPEACKLSEKVLTDLCAEERLNWSFTRITCLGFMNAFCIPHIDTVGTNNIARVDTAKKMLLEAQMKKDAGVDSRPIFGFGVDEKAAVVYEGGKLKIFSAGPRATGVGDATCHILFVNNLNQVMCIPITPNTGEALSMDELIDRAMRSVMALQSPLDLIVSEGVSNACHRRGCSEAIDFMTFIEDPTTMEQSLRNELPDASAIEFTTLGEKKKSLSFSKKLPGSSASKPQDPPVHVLPLKETCFLHENVAAPPSPPHVIPPFIETSVMHEVNLTPYHLNKTRSQSVL
jgi:dipeptidase E